MEKIHKEKIQLPKNLDILLYLPKSREPKNDHACIAHALQYNISATGSSPEDAVERLINLVIQHCTQAMSSGINPARTAGQHYWSAFAMGTPMNETYINVHARVSLQLARCFGQANVVVRSVSSLQERSGIFDIRELVKGCI